MSAPSEPPTLPARPESVPPTVPDIIHELVERFERNRSQYRTPSYNETQVRREFLDPFFEALGWDVNNRQGYAEAYKDVVHEDAIRIAGKHKAPDYSFRVGGTRKFFVEAKKPAVDLARDPQPALQVRRYAWSAKLPLSILTDFEELAVYDCRIPPEAGDRASTARTMLIPFQEYPARWGDIYGRFSRDAVLKGSFDQYTDSAARKRGTDHVDAVFLRDLQSWREILAHNIALRNPGITVRELNFAVQQILDRIVFLRIAEDRQIEDYGKLRRAASGKDSYRQIAQLFRKAEEKYNSGLFHFKQEKGRTSQVDEITLGLKLDDRVLRDIVTHLYYPDSPYEFSVVSADILGQVYEQFLGQVIRLTPGGHAVVEDKPAVRKAGGVFYTPTFVVAYIVLRTVGRLLEGKTPKQVSSLRFVDPACGSGSFLIAVYEYLLNWHLAFYIADGPEKHARGRPPRVYQASGGEWRLTTDEKKRILLNSVFGVDIDPQAVEVAKLSLLLKVLEGETEETLGAQLALFQERVLPDLSNNIKCGNSLVGPDIYTSHQATFWTDEDVHRVNAFDWEREFPEIMAAGGFDAVLGNPPYIRMEAFKELKDYLRERYSTHDERSDLYVYFVEAAHRILKPGGRFGMILSNKFLRAKYGQGLREFLERHATIEEVYDLAGLPVFPQATVRTIILITSVPAQSDARTHYTPPMTITSFRSVAGGSFTIAEASPTGGYTVGLDTLQSGGWSFIRPEAAQLLARLEKEHIALKEYCNGHIWMGIKSGLTDAFVIDDATRMQILATNPEAAEIIKPYLNGRDVRRYYVTPTNQYLIYTFHGVQIERYPAIEQHLQPYKDRLLARATKQEWYELQQPQLRYASAFGDPKIIFPDIAVAPRFALDDAGYFGSNTTYVIPLSDPYLLGLLNSRFASFYFSSTCAGLEGSGDTYLRFFGQYLEGFPVPKDSVTSSAGKHVRADIVSLVEQISAGRRSANELRSSYDRNMMERRMSALDDQLDRLVYELYGLGDKEMHLLTELDT